MSETKAPPDLSTLSELLSKTLPLEQAPPLQGAPTARGSTTISVYEVSVSTRHDGHVTRFFCDVQEALVFRASTLGKWTERYGEENVEATIIEWACGPAVEDIPEKLLVRILNRILG